MFFCFNKFILPPCFNDSTFIFYNDYAANTKKITFKMSSAANLMQRYTFLLKDARNLGKMFESGR